MKTPCPGPSYSCVEGYWSQDYGENSGWRVIDNRCSMPVRLSRRVMTIGWIAVTADAGTLTGVGISMSVTGFSESRPRGVGQNGNQGRNRGNGMGFRGR
jgi:hypothetical protein